MAGKRFAVIIAISNYMEADLKQLVAPAQDAEALAKILKDPEIGDFEITILLNETHNKIMREINNSIVNVNRHDLLLIYISCHGLKNEEGHLYFAASNTERNLLDATAIPANFVNDMMRKSLSSQQILILDCCFGGAFAKGMIAKDDKRIHLDEHFGIDDRDYVGGGRIVITSSDSTQYSFEGDNLSGTGEYSIFTSAIIEGLRTGEADLDKDGIVSHSELFEYARNNVRNSRSPQTPTKWEFNSKGSIKVANNHFQTKDSNIVQKNATARIEEPILPTIPDPEIPHKGLNNSDWIKGTATIAGKSVDYTVEGSTVDLSSILENDLQKIMSFPGMVSSKGQYSSINPLESKLIERNIDEILTLLKKLEYKVEKLEGIKAGELSVSTSHLLLIKNILEGNRHFFKVDYEKAIEYYNKALDSDIYWTDAWYNKGRAFEELKKYEDAIESYEKTIRIDKKYVDAWYNKARLIYGKIIKSRFKFSAIVGPILSVLAVLLLSPLIALSVYGRVSVQGMLLIYDYIFYGSPSVDQYVLRQYANPGAFAIVSGSMLESLIFSLVIITGFLLLLRIFYYRNYKAHLLQNYKTFVPEVVGKHYHVSYRKNRLRFKIFSLLHNKYVQLTIGITVSFWIITIFMFITLSLSLIERPFNTAEVEASIILLSLSTTFSIVVFLLIYNTVDELELLTQSQSSRIETLFSTVD